MIIICIAGWLLPPFSNGTWIFLLGRFSKYRYNPHHCSVPEPPLEYIKLIRKISNDFIIIYLYNDNDIIMNLHIKPIIQDGSLDYLQGYTHKCSWIRSTFHTHTLTSPLTTTTTGQFEFRLYILDLQFFKTSVCIHRMLVDYGHITGLWDQQCSVLRCCRFLVIMFMLAARWEDGLQTDMQAMFDDVVQYSEQRHQRALSHFD